jgi:hypothetical protein
VRLTVVLTGTFTVSAVAAAASPSRLATPVAVLDVVLFGVGLLAFSATMVLAAGRSRHEELSVSGLFLLTGSAPPAVRRALLTCLGIQTLVAFATAAVRPFTPLAFGVLVPTLGLGACGLWAARHGTFPDRAGRGGAGRPGAGPAGGRPAGVTPPPGP